MYNATILLDSVNPAGSRLTTMRVTMPRFILAEFNTHRQFSRNAGSSRAIPIERRIRMVEDHPFIPSAFGKNQKGMQAKESLEGTMAQMAEEQWRQAAKNAVNTAAVLSQLGVHKQLANRILEPFSWVEVIVSSTSWDNFFSQRISSLAQPEMQTVAELMQTALVASTPTELMWDEWHAPLCPDNHYIAAARLARVSYERDTVEDAANVTLAERLMNDKHWSPFEHIAKATAWLPGKYSRNFDPSWIQWRALLDTED